MGEMERLALEEMGKRLDRIATEIERRRDYWTNLLDLVSADMHTVSTRPCPTCRTLSKAIGKPFGCYAYQAKLKARQDRACSAR